MGGIVDKHSKKYSYNYVEDLDLLTTRYRPERLEDLSSKTKFSKREVQLIYRSFKQECPNGIVDRDRFKQIYQQYFPEGDASLYARHVFDSMDKKKSGSLTFEDFLLALSTASRGTYTEKLEWVFSLYDVNKNGNVSKSDMYNIVGSVHRLVCRKTARDEQMLCAHVEMVFQELDANKDGIISLQDFITSCQQNEEMMTSMTFLDTVLC